jgi:anaphase-promoting complex subunit 5
MTRFLTPSKIGLLALIELYTDGIASASSTVPILSFILNQLLSCTLPETQSNASTSPPHNLPYLLNLKSFETLLSAHPSASGLPGRTLWDHFLKKLWDIDSLDALHIFFTRRSHLLAKTREETQTDGDIGIPPPSPDMIILSRTSPLGSFVRRTKVEFERLRFSDAQILWMSFKTWRQETKTYWGRRCGLLGKWAGDIALEDGEEFWGPQATEWLESVTYGSPNVENGEEQGCLSSDDVEKLLEFQVEQMQSEWCFLFA